MAAASSYVLQGAYVSPWSGPGTLGVTNLDTSGKVVTVTTVGAAMTPGETYTLAAYGDAVTIDLGTIASFSIAASAYPATILLLVTPVSGVPIVTANPAVGSTVGRRYLGEVTITANGSGAASGTFPMTLQQADRYLSVIQPSTWRGVSGTSTAQTNDPAISPAIPTATGGSAGPLVTLPVIPDLTLLWEVAFSTSQATPGQSFTFYLFADQGPEVVQVEAGLSNVPVNVAGLNGAAITGQATSLFSFPVVIASDQSGLPLARLAPSRHVVGGAANVAPGAATPIPGWGVPVIPVSDTQTLAVGIVKVIVSASVRATTMAAGVGVLDVYLSDGSALIYLCRLHVTPGVAVNWLWHPERPFDPQHILNTGVGWTGFYQYSVQAGTPGNVDFEALMDWGIYA